MTEEQQTGNDDHLGRIKLRILGAVGLLIPFLASIPPLAAWGGLMTIPFIFYILLMIGNIGNTSIYLYDIPNVTAFLIPLVLLIYCIVYLWRRRDTGLVTGGPYHFVRHPQYCSLIVFTGVVTYQSVWILRHTFGIGWLSADQTIILWIVMLLTYSVIASIEEIHLQKVYGLEWIEYRNKVGFLIPLVRFQSRIIETLVCLAIPLAVLYSVLYLIA